MIVIIEPWSIYIYLNVLNDFHSIYIKMRTNFHSLCNNRMMQYIFFIIIIILFIKNEY